MRIVSCIEQDTVLLVALCQVLGWVSFETYPIADVRAIFFYLPRYIYFCMANKPPEILPPTKAFNYKLIRYDFDND